MPEKRCGVNSVFRHYAVSTVTALLLLFIPGSAFFCDAAEEYAVKSVFTLNFARYAKWPDEAFESDSSPCTLCVMGNYYIEQAFRGVDRKKVGSRKLEIRFTETPGDSGPCRMIFISRTVDEQNVLQILESVKGKPVLTIGETKEFLQQGGMISFLNKNGRLVFGINMDIVRRQKVKLSSRLLKLAILTGEK